VRRPISARLPITVDLLCAEVAGGQRATIRFIMIPIANGEVESPR
jgi:hypothetical protein